MLKTGRVVLDGRFTLDCTVRDMSRTGARLVFGAVPALSSNMELLVPSSQFIVPIEVVWRSGLAMGVKFIGPQRQA